MAVNIDAARLRQAYLFNTGADYRSYFWLGCQQIAAARFSFSVWAPNAQAVYLVGSFNEWQEDLPLLAQSDTGIWSVETSQPQIGDLYKFLIVTAGGQRVMKIDPYAHQFEKKPGNAAIVMPLPQKKWRDSLWLARRKKFLPYQRPVNIYEVHLGSWRRHADDSYLSYTELAQTLIPYVKQMGYTHIELMPIMEHLLDASWGYQLMGYFAPTSRFGGLTDFLDFIEQCHQANIGVIVDWVPGHFIRNTDALAQYDGTPTFEYQDAFRADNHRWGSWNFDLGKAQVQSFLISSALYWLDFCHLDGLRVDAVSNMLYLDYDAGKEGTVNEAGTNANLEGIAFIKKLNQTVFRYHPDILMVAEESSAYPQVSHPVATGGLGFNYKWNMGWMNDTLRFFELDPLYRHAQFNLLTFSFMYTFDEQFVLPFSHDEVVHGKKSLMHKMPGDRYNQFANLRTLMVYLMLHPGKKLTFMGSEWGQFLEWRHWSGLEWVDLADPLNHKMQEFVQTLNQLYRQQRSLWEQDHQPAGLTIIDADDPASNALSFLRQGKHKYDFLVGVFNFIPQERQHFRVGVPYAGTYHELLNTESKEFGGTWTKLQGTFTAEAVPYKGQPYSIQVILPAAGALIIQPQRVR
ncbi:1,4-alpha-glucan branching protein GlgB [Loigolactobacillus zhaoyuanensis]|uniref:1,4-alpha-glucan branching enzyme GlgB n=1 Tax=Loigolactobacillus zhaoyuanensis TaxID=2486017 RepID=A0ABW8UE32_9LACO